jgi:hypothetical protein
MRLNAHESAASGAPQNNNFLLEIITYAFFAGQQK